MAEGESSAKRITLAILDASRRVQPLRAADVEIADTLTTGVGWLHHQVQVSGCD